VGAKNCSDSIFCKAQHSVITLLSPARRRCHRLFLGHCRLARQPGKAARIQASAGGASGHLWGGEGPDTFVFKSPLAVEYIPVVP
jgi:hypothetical protein